MLELPVMSSQMETLAPQFLEPNPDEWMMQNAYGRDGWIIQRTFTASGTSTKEFVEQKVYLKGHEICHTKKLNVFKD